MYYTITLKHHSVVNGMVRATYTVCDTCFTTNVSLVCPTALTEQGSLEPVAVLAAYVKAKRNVARNIAIYYSALPDSEEYLVKDKELIDKAFPSFNYGKTLYSLVKRYHNDLQRAFNQIDEFDVSPGEALKRAFNFKV
jgi:hypothetical protein